MGILFLYFSSTIICMNIIKRNFNYSSWTLSISIYINIKTIRSIDGYWKRLAYLSESDPYNLEAFMHKVSPRR